MGLTGDSRRVGEGLLGESRLRGAINQHRLAEAKSRVCHETTAIGLVMHRPAWFDDGWKLIKSTC